MEEGETTLNSPLYAKNLSLSKLGALNMCLTSIEENVLKESDLSLPSMPGKLHAQSISFQ